MEELKQILSKFTPEDTKAWRDTTDMLCSKGIANGVYQDFALLMDVISVLTVCEKIIKEGELIDG
jgi:hypothetical protein